MDEALKENWRKSRYSGGNGGNCIEVANAPGALLVRDTTDRGGFTMPVDPGAWSGFLRSIRAGKLDAIG